MYIINYNGASSYLGRIIQPYQPIRLYKNDNEINYMYRKMNENIFKDLKAKPLKDIFKFMLQPKLIDTTADSTESDKERERRNEEGDSETMRIIYLHL